MFESRHYQSAALDAIFDYWQKEPDGNPLVDLATGTGKAFVIAALIREIMQAAPGARILMLVHVRELVRQNFEELLRYWPGAPAGINSAGLGRRDVRAPIICASIQSVHKHAAAMGPRDLVIVDEAHLLPQSGDGMYRKLIADLRALGEMRIVGFTATPFRLDCGRLDRGENRLFDRTVYSYGIAEGVRDGFLSPLVSKGMQTEIDVSQVARRGGEFIAGALESAADTDALTRAAVSEICEYGRDRRSWLVFCSGVKHAQHVADAFRAVGISAAAVTGDTPTDERDRILADFKAGRIRCLTNMSVLTTGFNAPGVDLVAMLRPTLSTGLYVQMLGRGTRLAPGKSNCLVLDFSGNIRRHGAVDDLEIATPTGGNAGAKEGAVLIDTIRLIACPHCRSYISPRARTCPECLEVVREEPKHDAKADNVAVMSHITKADGYREVDAVSFARHAASFDKPAAMRVEYHSGRKVIKEWIFFDHPEGSFPRRKANGWWMESGGQLPIPATVADALTRTRELRTVVAVKTRDENGYDRVIARRFARRDERAAG